MYDVKRVLCRVLVISAFTASTVTAQDEPAPELNAATLSSRFIPDDATASLRMVKKFRQAIEKLLDDFHGVKPQEAVVL